MPTTTNRTTPLAIELSDTALALGALPSGPVGSPEFLRHAGRAGRLLPALLHNALTDFADTGHQSGAVLFRGLPTGSLPPTPERPTAETGKDLWTEYLLLTVARVLGQPVGYLPEHGGDVVQNIVPTKSSAARQTSTSSNVELLFHTETAFHAHRPRYLILFCLRGDPTAATTLSSIRDAMSILPDATLATLRQPRFRTAADESFRQSVGSGTRPGLGAEFAALTGSVDTPTLIFDADLMVGTDPEASEALRLLSTALQDCHGRVVLESGDLLVVDNFTAVHGRTPFRARFDGTDRWLQRAFVVSDLAPSAGERIGRIITTKFN